MKIRVHQIAKELGKESKDVLEILHKLGFEAKAAASTVDDYIIPRIRKELDAAQTCGREAGSCRKAKGQSRKKRSGKRWGRGGRAEKEAARSGRCIQPGRRDIPTRKSICCRQAERGSVAVMEKKKRRLWLLLLGNFRKRRWSV